MKMNIYAICTALMFAGVAIPAVSNAGEASASAFINVLSAPDKDGNEFYEKGNKASDNGNFEEAVKWWRKAADLGHVKAQNTLGVCYATGKGVEQSHEEAIKWYRKAAEQGHAIAQNNLGICYAKGKGVTQSIEEAVKWYRTAAEQGYAEAQYNLGYYYEHVKDFKEAAKWYRKAAEQDYAGAKAALERLGY